MLQFWGIRMPSKEAAERWWTVVRMITSSSTIPTTVALVCLVSSFWEVVEHVVFNFHGQNLRTLESVSILF
jgi:hypothetical protein